MVKVVKDSTRATVPPREEQTQQTLRTLRTQSEEQQAADLARTHELLYADLHILPLNVDDIKQLSEELVQKHGVAVFQKSGKRVRMATVDPTRPELAEFLDHLQQERGWKIVLYVVSPSSFAKIRAQYKSQFFVLELESRGLSLSGADVSGFDAALKDLLRLRNQTDQIATTDVIRIIMAGGVKMSASDIHLEVQEDGVRLRYRIDGVLQDIAHLPLKVHKLMTSRIKLMGGMKINIRDMAQDGHFSFTVDDAEIDVRVSVIPDKNGESIVMRLLKQSSVLVDMEELGLRGRAFAEIQKQMMKSNGMILTTGPTGSGKTTTLYSIINRINRPESKVITIEDPVEYQIAGITQTQVSKDRGYTFAKGLAAIVRQDPDTILVGEIRDEETADIAINAALTGHLVLSTLHTNNAAATIPRLFELGVKPSLIPPATNAFMAQRLVRKLCTHCKEAYEPAESTIESIKKILSLISPRTEVEIPKEITHLYRAAGCAQCHNSGYSGRIGIFEVLTMNENIERLIMEMAGETEIMRQAMEDGMLTMTQDGVLKAIEGTTSLDEVWRVTSEGDFLEEMYENLVDQSLSRSIPIAPAFFETATDASGSFATVAQTVARLAPKEILPQILAYALHFGAADIHIEPQEQEVIIRLRLDGVLQTVASVPLTEYPTLLGKVKLLSGIKTQVREGVKDSRFRIDLLDAQGGVAEKIDVRVSLILGGFGETVVLRLLNTAAVKLDVATLGIRIQNLEKIMQEITKPYGVFLNTGPTGSGKTTTLYSLLAQINTPSVKIITIEDPIEYQLTGVLQTQVNAAEDYTFATALRALLRQDPDIMMVGEIRDEETATVAMQAALTGHLILSTLHTNDAVGSVQRLLTMGVRADDIITAVNAFMAQRLVRKLCDCKQEVPLADTPARERLLAITKTISPKTGVDIPPLTHVYAPGSCSACNAIGFKGRTLLSEVFILDNDAKELIAQGALMTEIKEKAMQNGMLTMLQDGALKALEGETTLEEVERVTS